MRLKPWYFFCTLTAFRLWQASVCTAQSEGCWYCFLPWFGARLLPLPGSFQHLSPSEFWSSQGCLPDQCQWGHPFVPAQTLPTVCTALSHPENDSIHLRWVPQEKEEAQDSGQQKPSFVGDTFSFNSAAAKVPDPFPSPAQVPYALSPRMHLLDWSSWPRSTQSKQQNK